MLFVRTRTKTADFEHGCYVTSEKSYAVASERGLTAIEKGFDEAERIIYKGAFSIHSTGAAEQIVEQILAALDLYDMSDDDLLVMREYVFHVLDAGLLLARK